MKVDPSLVEEYERTGAVCVRGAFDREWVELARRGIDKNLAAPSSFAEKNKGTTGDGVYFNDYCNWQWIEEFKKYALESPAAELVGTLMKSKEVSFYHEHVLVKEPGTDKETPWHHDQAYYPIDGEKVCSVWMPVDPVARDTCVRFVSGSHRWGWFLPRKFETGRPYPELRVPDREFRPVPDVDAEPDRYEVLTWDLQPGDCIVFHMKCLHGAPGNTSGTRWRRVLSTRWFGDDAVMSDRPWEVSPPVRGGLSVGQRAVGRTFPLVWRKEG